MTLKLIQRTARDLRIRIRVKLLAALGGPFVIGLVSAYSMREFAPLRHVLYPYFALALAWSIAGLYFLNRGMWDPALPPDAGFRTGLEFCRQEITRQQNLIRRQLVWFFPPVVLTIGVFVSALVMVSTPERGLFPAGLPFLIALAVWIGGYVILRIRERRQLQGEIDELNEVEELER
jgi:hypothetical protein